MRKAVLVFLAVMLAAGMAAAASYSVQWEPNPPGESVTAYVVTKNGTQVWQGPQTVTPGIEAITGDVFRVRAVNQWGQSGDSEPAVVGAPPSVPGNVRLVTINITVN